MLANEEAEMLLKIPKWVVGGNGRGVALLPRCEVSLSSRQNLYLSSKDGSRKFMLAVGGSPKRALKLRLHHQTASPENTGLLRVEYNGGGHRNPPGIPEGKFLPEKFFPHIGRVFARGEPHIHHYVAGFRDLPWAVPLRDDDFPVKGIRSENGMWRAFRAFGAAIALMTEARRKTDADRHGG